MISGIILAGGKNSRMNGVDKAFLKINSKAIILRTLDIFKDIFEEIWIITNTTERYRFLKSEKVFVVPDLIKNKGPLAGIYTGLKYMTNEAGFFVACDMPDLHIDLIKRQILLFQKGKFECLVPVYPAPSCQEKHYFAAGRGGVEPLHGIYAKKLAERIYSCIARGAGVNEFLKTCNCSFVEASREETASFANLNTMGEYKKWK